MDGPAVGVDAGNHELYDNMPVSVTGLPEERPRGKGKARPKNASQALMGGDAVLKEEAPRFKLESLASMAFEPGAPWLIRGLLPSSGLHIIYGAPSVGKSFVALHAALHVATGSEWAGREAHQRGVVYVASEGGVGFRRRVVAARDHLKVPEDAPFALVTQAPNLGRAGTDVGSLVRSIRAQTKHWPVSLGLIVRTGVEKGPPIGVIGTEQGPPPR